MKNRPLMNSKKLNYAVRQCGASLLEGIAYLGIAAIVILGAVSLLANAFNSAQTNSAEEEVVSIRTGVRKLYMGQPGGYGSTGSITANLIAAHMFPASLIVGTSTVTHKWGGTVSVDTVSSSLFSITYTAVPQDVCVNLLSNAVGWTGVGANVAVGAVAALPITPGAAVTACSVTSAAGNTIIWTAS